MGKRIALLGLLAACSSTPPPYKAGDPLTLRVGGAFPAGTAVRDAYGGSTATVTSGGSVTVTPDASGVVLLERDGASPSAFTWADATVYFVLTDRFFNGDPSNDGSYGRAKDGAQEVGTWHGGDFKGLTQKLDYIASLGVTALWISPIVEQVHGWVAGGSGDFKYYGYTGYWALDFTRLDQNLGNAADLHALVDGAHQRGIRVLVDVVMNHPGYATGDDLLAYLPEVFKDPTGNDFRAFTPGSGGYADWNNLVNYASPDWTKWWSPAWIRAGLGPPGTFPSAGTTDLTKQLTFLPDFITEGSQAAGVPTLFTRKASDTGVTAIAGGTVRDYLVKWHTDWVRQFGIDGFRCDTAKNVELASWKALKDAAVPALRDWKAANPMKKIDDSDFWMTGEVYGHGVTKDDYFFSGGFDSVINFDFQGSVRDLLAVTASLAAGADALESVYARYASAISADPSFDVLSYLSSHDTRLFFGDIAKNDVALQKQAGTALLLVPGGAQIFYGDESGRRLGPALSDAVQATRSDMNWTTTDAAVLAHWQKLGAFRKRHVAVGAGVHEKLTSPSGTYAFSRKRADDAVVVVLTPPR